MRVLLTGSSGYLGRKLLVGLAGAGHDVDVLLRSSSHACGSPLVRRVLHDDGSADTLKRAFDAQSIDAVIHAAAMVVGAHDHAPGDAGRLIDGNVVYAARVLETAASSGVGVFVNTGSFWEYGANGEYRPVNLYAATKKAFSDICVYYALSSGMTVIDLVLSDVYGPEDTRGRLMQQLVESAFSGASLLLSPGEQKMRPVYIDDVVSAYIRAIDRETPVPVRDNYAEYFVSGPQMTTVKDLVARVSTLSGRPIRAEFGRRPYREREIMHPWNGVSLPGWEARVDLDAGIRSVLDCYSRNFGSA